MMADLFNVEVNTINYHLKEIFKSQELNENSVIRKFRIVQETEKPTKLVFIILMQAIIK